MAALVEGLEKHAGSKFTGFSTKCEGQSCYAQYHLKDGTVWRYNAPPDIYPLPPPNWKCVHIPLSLRVWRWILSKL